MPWTRSSTLLMTALVVLASLTVPASWTPRGDEWAVGRGDLGHTGAASGTSLFLPGAGGPAKIKWSRDVTYPVLYPPTVADLDRNGVKEVVVTDNDIKTQVGPPPDIQFNHRTDVLGGAAGAPQWGHEETNSFHLFTGANVVDLDADANAEVLYFSGNPLTGTGATNKVVARAHDGSEQWRFSSLDWGQTQHPVGLLTATQAANLDGEPLNEAVVGVSLADILIDTTAKGPGCPNPTGQKIRITASNLHYFVHALNGDGSNPTLAWQTHVNPGVLISTPAVLDLNGDGRLDVVWGSGAPEGVLIPSCSAEVRVDASAVDDRVIAIDGAHAPNVLWTHAFENPVGVRRPATATPVVAGTTAGGDPILAFLVPVAPGEPAANDPDRNILVALNGRTGSLLWSVDLRPASIAPLAAADLDGDGQPEIIAQVADRLVAFRNDGSNFWPQGTDALRGIAYARQLTSFGVAVGDLDSDGTPEIAAILQGGRLAGDPMAELLVVDGATGAVEWTFAFLQDSATAGPVLADVDGDDSLLEIVLAGGSFTLGDAVDHAGKVVVLEPNAPDLAVLDVNLVGNGVHGSPQTVRANVRNDGTRSIESGTPFVVEAYAVDAFGNVNFVGSAGLALAPGASQTLDFAWTPPAAGAWTLRVVGDPDEALRELSEKNNEQSRAVTILKRFDLSVSAADISFQPASPILGDTVTVTARVRNVGDVATPAANAARFVEAGIPLSQDRTVPVLAAGASADLSVTFTVAEERTHHIVVTADPDGALVEEREDNNEAAKDLAVRVVRPDLETAAADISFSNASPALGDTVTISAVAHNVGNQDAPASKARVLESGAPVGPDLDVPALAQGATRTLQASFTIAEEREHQFRVALDPDDTVRESDEANNAANKPLAVRFTAPDLVAASLAASPGITDPGGSVQLSASFRNDGDRNLAGFNVDFFDGATLLGTAPGSALAVGASTPVPFTWTATAPRAPHALRAVGVPTATELRSDNNEATANVVVGTLAVAVVMDQADFHHDDTVTGTVTTRFAGTSVPVPAVPIHLEVFYTAPGLHLARSLLDGTTDASGAFRFTVPKTLLGQVTVCVNGDCLIDNGAVAGVGLHTPGTYEVLAHADRLGFDFHGTGAYAVSLPPP